MHLRPMIGIAFATSSITTTTFAAPEFGMSAGIAEALATKPHLAHAGLYLNLGVSMVFDTGWGYVIPGLALTGAPDTGAIGLVASCSVDFPIIRDVVGFDLTVLALTDQPGFHFGDAIVLVGGGPGITVALPASWSLSVGVNGLFGPFGADPGLSLVALAGHAFR